MASGGTVITDLSNCTTSGINGYQSPPQHGVNDSRNNNSTGLVYYTNNGDSSTTDSFSVIDGDDNSVIPFSVTVQQSGPSVTTTTLPNAVVGNGYSRSLSASGGSTPYTWSLTGGGLPNGLALSSAGVVSGTPTQAGNFNPVFTVTDSANRTASRALSLNVSAPTLVITPTTLPNPVIGTAYNQTLGTSGGTAPYTYSVSGGGPPPGISVSSTGTVSGNATTPGNYSFTVGSTDSSTGSGAPFSTTRTYSVTVSAPTVTVAPATLPNPTVGVAYSQTVSASGGTAPYAFAITAGALPAGMTLGGGGALSGTPTAAGTFNFTVTATDNGGFTGSRAYTVTVAAPTIAIAPASLPNAVAGQAYSATVTASGGTPSYSYSVTAGSLPSGIALSQSGVISGTSTVAGSFNFTVRATDSSTGAGAPFSGARSYTLTVTAPSVVVAPTTLPNLTVGAAYSQTVSASGGTAPYSFAVTAGATPAGVALSTSGVLSGTPTAGGTFNFTVTATDSGGFTGTRAYTVTVAAPTIAIAPASLPNAVAGQAYSSTVTANGGTAPYSFAVTAGSLPSGITLSRAGVLSGTSTVAGTFNFTVMATDSSGGAGAPFSGSRAYALTVAAPTLVVAPATLPNPTVGVAYSQSVTASGGTAPYTFAITTGALPAGLTLAGGGTLSGTPTAAGTFNFTVTVADSGGFTGARAYTVTVAAPTIAIAPASLPNAVAGQAYSSTVAASGGTAPYSFAVTAGSLPSGITLSRAGVLSGTSTVAGNFTFTVSATDSSTGAGAPFTGARTYTLTVGAPSVVIAPGTLPNPTAGVAYSQTVTASGGTAPYAFAITTGALPAGLTLASGGTLTGTPTAVGTFNFTVTAIDGNGFTGARAYTVTVGAPTVVVAPAILPNATTGAAYSQTVSAVGGTAPYTFAVTAGAMSSGLTLSAAGVLSGTPTAGGTFNFTVTATDGGGFSGARAYALTVAGPTVTLSPTSLPNGTAGSPYSQTLTASGGTAPYTYAVTAGSLPAGLMLSSAGALSGTPTQSGSFTFTVRATDSTGGSGPYSTTQTYTLAFTTAGSTITLASSPNPSMAGQAVTLTATVTSAAGIPTGTVTFANGGTVLGTATLVNGVATLTTTTLPVGTSTLTATYGGGGSVAAGTGTTTQTVNTANTNVSLASSANPSTFGQAVTFTATVTGQSPTGTVTFQDGGTTLGTAALSNGIATFSTTNLAAGSHPISAIYAGDARNTASTSQALTQAVNTAATTTTLTSSANPSTFGQAVTFTATVTGQNPTGTVTFQDGGTTLGAVSLANGTAAFSTATLKTGSHTITAVYAGDPRNTASTSAVLAQAVNAAATTTTLVSSRNPSARGQAVAFTATVTGANGAPTGTVTFKDGGTTLGAVPLANGTATFSTADLSTGAHTITAAYAGDTSYAASTSGTLTQQVNAVVGGVTLTIATVGRDGSFGFASTLPGAASFTLTSSGNRATRTFVDVQPGTYSIASLGVPSGFALQGFSCTGGTAGASGSVTFAVTAGASVSCTFTAGFDEAAIRRTTQAAIRTFLQQRAEVVAQAQPETRRFHDRFSGSLFGDDSGMGGGLAFARNPIDITGSTTLGGMNLSGSTSLSRIMRPEQKLEFDAWFDVRSGAYHDAAEQGPLAMPTVGLRAKYSGSFTLAFAGVDYRLQPGVLVGVLGQFDQVRQNSSSTGTAAGGTGYMLGPYASLALTPQLFFDARAAYGVSSNAITPTGLPQSAFSTDRQLYRAELSGLYRFGDLSVLPSVSALYFSERQLAFTDSLAVRIPGQRVGLGQLAVGPEFAYTFVTPYGSIVPRIATKAIYSFNHDEKEALALGIVQPTAPLRARIEGGIDLQDFCGFVLGSSIGYDGIGDTRYGAISGSVSLRKQF